MSQEFNHTKTISDVVRRAAMDMYAQLDDVKARYTMWAVDSWKEINDMVIKSGIRRIILPINKNTNSATLPIDFEDDTFVAFIDDCGLKVPLSAKNNIVSKIGIDKSECDGCCDKGCTSCYDKALCNELSSKEIRRTVKIYGVDYEEVETSTLMPTGEYYVETKTPMFDAESGLITYPVTREYKAKLELEVCGCIKETEENSEAIKTCCPDLWACYCSPCSEGVYDLGGYKIFKDIRIIQLDNIRNYENVYLEYRGSLPRVGNEYIIPAVAYEALVAKVKYNSIANKKGVPLWERQDFWRQYEVKFGNMKKSLRRVHLSQIVQSLMKTPKFDFGISDTASYY